MNYDYLQIGEIINTHGVRGELKILPLTDDPSRYDLLEWVYIEKEGILHKYDIENIKYFKDYVILKLGGIDSIEAAEALRGLFLLIDRSNAVKLPENSYFICDIIGCTVTDMEGVVLGKLVNVLQTGSNDVYVVSDESKREILLPALKSVIREVSIENAVIRVEVPEGLLNDQI